ncbi:MAG: sugar phosphate nucleotidyltransferase [Bacilli bacterium]|nr:sugar phosphate nucleotidyltransferase [Bacilli bacterium]
MSKYHLIMPMGGKGSRFFEKGFLMPKPIIKINDKPFFYWATKSIINFIELADLTFVVLQEHIDEFYIDVEIKKFFPEAHIVALPQVLNGAVLTCVEGVKNIEDDLPLIFNDCDHMFISNDFYKYCNTCDFDVDGALLTFKSNDTKFSYIQFDENNNIVGTKEKEVVSSDAICGVYCFKNKKIFLDNVKKYLDNCNYSEYFISGVYNVIASQGNKIINFKVDNHTSFGTPQEFDEALKSTDFERVK